MTASENCSGRWTRSSRTRNRSSPPWRRGTGKGVCWPGAMPRGKESPGKCSSVPKATEDRIARLRESVAGLDPRPAGIDQQIETMTRDLREQSLEYGAAGRLASRGAIDVLPLDDADLLEGAKPVRPDGTVRFDPKKVEARHDGQVRRALAAGPCAVIVLGGAHDLSARVRRLGGGRPSTFD